jgi:hypothetical protein
VTDQLALVLEPVDALDLDHAERVLAEEAAEAAEQAAAALRPAPCECPHAFGWPDEEGEVRCALCGRAPA